jgi:glycosyltransferase involved in cell wall biosynthesis
MKVLLYNDSDGFGGIERHICDLAAALVSEGVEVSVVARQCSELERVATSLGLRVLTLSTGRPYTLRASRQLVGWIKSEGIDIVHAHNGRAAMISVLACRFAGRGVCVKSQHFLQPAHVSRRGPVAAMARVVHRRVNEEISAWISVSQAARTEMLDRREAPPDHITVVPNGIRDPDRSRLTAAQAIRHELGLDATARVAVCVARLEPEKDIRTLVNAWQQVAKELPDVHCVIAGTGSLEVVLGAHIQNLSLDSIKLIGFRSDPLSLIDAGDLLVLPSIAEPFGLVLLEAMALSKPVLSTTAGGPLEIVRDGDTGLLVPPSDPAALAQALVKLLSDRGLRDRLGRNGRARFCQEYTTERMARSTAQVYRMAVDANAAPAALPQSAPAVGDPVEVG